jgi:hypothetical protein
MLEKAGAERVGGNVLAETVDELAFEFNAIRSLNADLGVAVYHAMLAVAAHERRTNAEWNMIGSDYLNRMGFRQCQYLIVRHTDEPHDHIHIVASRIQIPDGETVSDSQDYQRSEAAIRELEQIYGLEPVQSSRGQLNRAPSTGEVRRFEKEQLLYDQGLRDLPPRPPILLVLQALISQLCADQPTISQLVERLRERGVRVRVGLTEQQQMGISYQFAGEHYSGTQLGAAYQFSGLQRYQGVSYEPARDQGICTELGSQYRTTAAITPTAQPVEPAIAAGAAAEFDLTAAIEQLDFRPSAAAQQIREFRDQSPEVAADADGSGEGAKSLVEQEIFESVAADFERICDCLNRDRAAAEGAERIRSQLAELARTVTLHLEQLQRNSEQAQLNEPANWLDVATLAIHSAEQILATIGADQADGSRSVTGRRYRLEQREAVLTISEAESRQILLFYESAGRTYSSDSDLSEVQEMANTLERVVDKINYSQTLLEIAQSFQPEVGDSIPSWASIEQVQQQIEIGGRQIKFLKRQLEELTNEINLFQARVEAANPFQDLIDRLAGEPQQFFQLYSQQQKLAENLLALQARQSALQTTADSAQAARQHEENRLKSIYQGLSQQVQQRTGLQERQDIDEAVALIILSSRQSQTERNLEALDFSPSVGQWRQKHSEQQISRYVQEILDKVRPEQTIPPLQIRDRRSNQIELELD